MNRLLACTGALALTLAAQTAFAADLRAPVTKAPAMVAAPLFNWSGFYVGGHAGYGWDDIAYTYVPGDSTTDFKIRGFVGGATAGYNWQAGSWLFGIEGDLSYSDIDGSILTTTTPCITRGEACSAELSWFGTGRLRVGFVAGHFMPFITGGTAVGKIKGRADFEACGPGCGYDDTRWGWTAGGGAEWSVGGNWTAKIEYLFVNLRSPSFAPDSDSVTSSDFTFHVARVGLNYRFATGKAPIGKMPAASPAVVTKY